MPEQIQSAYQHLKQIQPVSSAAESLNGVTIDTKEIRSLQFELDVGVMATSATLNALVQEDTASDMSGATTVPNSAITELTEAGGDSGKKVVITLKPGAWTKRFVRIRTTAAVAASLLSASAKGRVDETQPPSQTDIDELKAL